MKQFLLIAAGIGFVAVFSFLFVTQRRLASGEARIKDQVIAVEVASSPATRAKGLSGRENLADDTGLVFLFPVADKHSIWMKDMNFAIDILWVRNGEIVDIAPDVPPPAGPKDPLKIYRPRLEADMVIEVPAGFTNKYGIQIGDSVEVNME